MFRALVLLAALTTLAHADTPLEASKRFYEEGRRRYEVQEYAAALEEFKHAYEAESFPAFLFNIGQCQRLLGQRDAALRSYRMYLLRAPDATNRADVERQTAALEAELASPPAAVTITQPPPAKPPIYKRWWLWTGVSVVVVGVGLGVGLGLGLRPHEQAVGSMVTFF